MSTKMDITLDKDRKAFCPVCGHPASRKSFQMVPDVHVTFCPGCGSGWVIEGRLTSFVKESLLEEKCQYWEAFQSEETKFRLKKYVTMLKGFLKTAHRDVSGTSLCDLGCGYGYFLYLAKKEGFDPVLGLELAPRYVDLGRENYQVDISLEKASDLGKKRKFDVLTAFDVIEHVMEPGNLIQELKVLVKKDGIIIITTPCIDNWLGCISHGICRLFPKLAHSFLRAQGYSREHVQLFSTRALKNVLSKNGLKILKYVKMVDHSKPLELYSYPFARHGTFLHPYAVAMAKIGKTMGIFPKNKHFVIAGLK